MKSLVFFSKSILPRLCWRDFCPDCSPDGWVVQYIVFEGKQDLEKQLSISKL